MLNIAVILGIYFIYRISFPFLQDIFPLWKNAQQNKNRQGVEALAVCFVGTVAAVIDVSNRIGWNFLSDISL